MQVYIQSRQVINRYMMVKIYVNIDELPTFTPSPTMLLLILENHKSFKCVFRFIEGDFDTYVSHIRKPHVWGGEPELLMASHVLQ